MKLTLIETYSRTDYIDIEMNEEWLKDFKDYWSPLLDEEELENITLEAIEDYYNDNEKLLIFHIHSPYDDRVCEYVIDDLIADWKNDVGYEYPITDTVYGEYDCSDGNDWEVTF